MRKPIIAGNWKMNKTISETRSLVTDLVPGLQAIHNVEKVLCPPFTALMAVAEMLDGTDIFVGAQDVYWESSGAFTGEIAPAMIAEFCQYVIIGHSERRTYFYETDETVNLKTKATMKQGLIPIVCVGETLQENEDGKTADVVSRQIGEGLKGIALADDSKLVIAYEPVWAIGTGKAATAPGANAVLKDVIRPGLQKLFGEKASQAIRILYGGSVSGKNAEEFFAQPDIDGALVGGASLKAEDFSKINQAAAK
jgi:triosephosphate isomerase